MHVLNKLPRWLVWEITLPLTLLNGWLLYKTFQFFQTPFTILITATLLSFLLNYPIEQLEKRGIEKEISIAVIVLLALGLLGVAGVTLVPILFEQLGDLASRFPDWLASSSQQFQAIDALLTAKRIPLDLTEIAERAAQIIPQGLVLLPDRALELLLGLADRLLEVVFTAVLTLYLLLQGDKFWNGLLGWLPGEFPDLVRPIFREQFRNYFVGQAAIAAIMATALTVVFFLFNIPYWLVFGVGIGSLALIPFGESLGIITAASVVSFKSVLLGGEVIAIALITDQIVDNAIAPRLLGNLIGLNPVWILISLIIGAQFGGFLGLLLAVPLAGSLKRIAKILLPEKDPAQEPERETVLTTLEHPV